MTGYHMAHKNGKDTSKSGEYARSEPRTGSLRVRSGWTAIESPGNAAGKSPEPATRRTGRASPKDGRTVDSLRKPEEAVRFLCSVCDMKPAELASPENGGTSESLKKPEESARLPVGQTSAGKKRSARRTHPPTDRPGTLWGGFGDLRLKGRGQCG